MSENWMVEHVKRARMRQEKAEAHQASCTEDPCHVCGRHRCRVGCGARVDNDGVRCPACKEKARAEAWVRDARAQVPAKFLESTLDAPWLLALVGSRVIADASKAAGHEQVVAVGPPGSGKTSLIAAMLVVSDFSGYGAPLWVSAHQLAKARTLHPLGEGEAPLVARALAAGILIVDELGGEDARHASAVTEVIYERHAQMNPTWITSGVGPKEVAARYGGGIARRVFEDATVFSLSGRPR